MRVFLGLLLPPDTARAAARAAQAALGSVLDELRCVPEANLHLTLHFLGETPPERVASLRSALGRGLLGAPSGELCLRGGGGFPEGARKRVVWLGVDPPGAPVAPAAAGSDAAPSPRALGWLGELHARVLAALGQAGQPLPQPLEPLWPHVTVARSRSRGGLALPRAFRELELELRWRPEALCLFESLRDERHTRYPVLESWPLGAA